MATAREVAEWMLKALQTHHELYQDDAAYQIEGLFGSEFIYENENGNPAIDRRVLKEFRALTEDTVVWDRGERFWRCRDPSDPKGSRLADE